nr:MAG TPA: hypothetical protein [Caudoviricetes sp.]
MWNTIFNVVVIVLLTLLYGAISKLPSTVSDLIVEKYKSKSSKELQREIYFREISGKDVRDLFSEWLDLLIDTDAKVKSLGETNNIVKLIKRTILYGSAETVKICALFMNHIYGTKSVSDENDNQNLISENEQKEDRDVNNLITLIYVNKIICSLKRDFTGQDVTIEDLFKIRITDFNETENTVSYKKALETVNNKLKQ